MAIEKAQQKACEKAEKEAIRPPKILKATKKQEKTSKKAKKRRRP